MTDEEFIERAVAMRYLTPGLANEARRAREQILALGLELSAAEICVRRRFMTQEQADAVLGPEARGAAKRFGPFTIVAKLGEGGMGAVYKAVKEGESQACALKILPKKLLSDNEILSRFKREAKIATSLSHPNIVRGLEYGQIEQRFYFAMEFVDGELASDIVHRQGRLAERPALDIAIQIGSALVEIHARGLVHRDIKPENIIVDRAGVAKLMDLGLIKSVLVDVTSLTKTGFTVGTPNYMSYEQIMGRKDLDIRADVYSLGASVYHMVAGEAPFENVPMIDLLENFLDMKLVDPRVRQPKLSKEFCIVLSRMLAKERKDRYGTPEAMVQDLRLVRDGKSPRTRALAVMTPPRKP